MHKFFTMQHKSCHKFDQEENETLFYVPSNGCSSPSISNVFRFIMELDDRHWYSNDLLISPASPTLPSTMYRFYTLDRQLSPHYTNSSSSSDITFHLRSVSSKIHSRINPFTVRWGSNTLLRLSLTLLWTVMGMYIVMKEICVCMFMLVEVLK